MILWIIGYSLNISGDNRAHFRKILNSVGCDCLDHYVAEGSGFRWSGNDRYAASVGCQLIEEGVAGTSPYYMQAFYRIFRQSAEYVEGLGVFPGKALENRA